MKKPKAKQRKNIKGIETYLDERLMVQLEKAFESKTGIEANSPMIYEPEDENGNTYNVNPEHNIRTDKFEQMINFIEKSEELNREGRAKAAEEMNKKRKEEAGGEAQDPNN